MDCNAIKDLVLKTNMKDCYGCSACVSICPQNCLVMKENADGFLEPCAGDNIEACINCDLCNKACPVTNYTVEERKEQQGYIAQNTDEAIRNQSTSGGAFSAIAAEVIHQGGVVYGAAYDSQMKVVHIGVTSQEEVWRFRNSKYVQSDLFGVFTEVKQYLDSGRLVCFSGTPCQIEGLKKYLRKNYENLITVDVVCHGISSPLIWRKYLGLQKKYEADYIYFRKKHYGYKYSTMSLMKDGREVYYKGVESDPMLRAFFDNICDRETCYQCIFKKRYRESDITLWDCYEPSIFDKSFDDDGGTTRVLTHSEKGNRLVQLIADKKLIRLLDVGADELVEGVTEMVASVKMNPGREQFLRDAQQLDDEQFFEKYYPNTVMVRIRAFARLALVRLGIYKKLKYLVFFLREKTKKSK